MRLFALLAAILIPTALEAGAWTRPAGETYLLLQHEGGEHGWVGLYAERGGPWGLTMGLEAGGHPGAIRESDADARVRAFLRVPLLRRLEPWVLALEVGLGADVRTTDDPFLPVGYDRRASLGVSVGRPLSTRWGDGWANVDLRHARHVGDPADRVGPDRRHVLSAKVGIRPTRRDAFELGLDLESDADGDRRMTFGPTWQRGFGRLGAARIGAVVTGRGEARLRLGWTRTFAAAR